MELPPSQVALVLEQSAALAELGLEVQDFGGGTLMLSSYPALLGKHAPRDLLEVRLLCAIVLHDHSRAPRMKVTTSPAKADSFLGDA